MRLVWVLRALTPAPAALVALGCGLLGADDYRLVDEPGTEAGAPPATLDVRVDAIGLPLLPAQPDARRVDACEACAAAECAERRDECLESELCKAMLWCSGQCSDPSCLVRCRDTHPGSPIFERYFNCVFSNFAWVGEAGSCVEPCGSGDNLECLGEYAREQPPLGTGVRLQLEAREWIAYAGSAVGGLPGWEVGVCEDRADAHLDAPDHGCHWATRTDAYGFAELDVPPNADDALALKAPGDVEHIRLYRRQYVRDAFDLLNPLGLPFEHILRENLGDVPWDPSRGLVAAVQLDCLYQVHQRTRFTLEGADDGETTQWYLENLLPTASADSGGWSGFVNAPTGTGVLLRSERADGSGEILSERKIVIAPGWTTVVNLWPAARGER